MPAPGRRWGGIARFTGHVSGGPLHFPSGQPQWGYLPFGAIAWLHWPSGPTLRPPSPRLHVGDGNRRVSGGEVPFRLGYTHAVRLTCRTLPDDSEGNGVTACRFKVRPSAEPEPAQWNCEHLQTSAIALRTGGPCLVVHHVDATFGDIAITSIEVGRFP
jgi:hypothetical protein